MIVVKLQGGLGNQMFQYAAARSLAARHHAEVKIDLSFLLKHRVLNNSREFELHHLNVKPKIATFFEVAQLTGKGRNLLETGCLRILQAAGIAKLRRNLYREQTCHFESAFEALSDDVYLEGYWQSNRYFSAVEDIVRREFEVVTPMDDGNRELSERIQASNAVAVHVRRGDYVTDKEAARFHGICGIEYYRQAVAVISGQVEKPTFFVFSDDPEWSRRNLDFIPSAQVVDINCNVPACHDLRLMSLCSHYIIANSSFSWWGAWLGRRAGKTVIAPDRWYADCSIDSSHLCPQDWIKI